MIQYKTLHLPGGQQEYVQYGILLEIGGLYDRTSIAFEGTRELDQ